LRTRSASATQSWPVDFGAPSGRLRKRGEYTDRRRFAGAVGADKTEYLTMGDFKRNIAQNH
jgi:hypothetical protein